SNIDRTAPEIDYDRPDKWYDGETDITWIGNDLQPDGTEGSGLAEEAYSFDGVNFTALNTQRIPGAGVYKVWIRDKVGNTAEYDIEILYDRKPSSKGENTSPDTPPAPIEPPLPVIELADGGGNGGTDGSAALPEPIKIKQPQQEEILPTLVPMPEPEPARKRALSGQKAAEEKKAENEAREDKKLPNYGKILNYVTKGTAAASGGTVIYLVMFHVLHSAGILAMNAYKEYVYIGRRRLKKRRGRYQIRLDQYLYSKADTEFFQIKLGRRFVRKNRGKMLSVLYQGRKIPIVIDDEIKVRIPAGKK
ncbi:MAG: hypothetical protein J6C33_07420, partial [Lachnospiraceae bacterium]|nr:hypothetical protein [Lachnospiraceae bacterium]